MISNAKHGKFVWNSFGIPRNNKEFVAMSCTARNVEEMTS